MDIFFAASLESEDMTADTRFAKVLILLRKDLFLAVLVTVCLMLFRDALLFAIFFYN
jgi:hypothetical protein